MVEMFFNYERASSIIMIIDGVKVEIWLHSYYLFPEIVSRSLHICERSATHPQRTKKLIWTSYRSPPCRQAFNPADHHGGIRRHGYSFRNFGSEFLAARGVTWGNSMSHYPQSNGHAKAVKN
jgi:hypothetical protein